MTRLMSLAGVMGEIKLPSVIVFMGLSYSQRPAPCKLLGSKYCTGMQLVSVKALMELASC